MRIAERADKFVAALLAARDHPPSEKEKVRQMAQDAVKAVQSRLRTRRQSVRKFSPGRK